VCVKPKALFFGIGLWAFLIVTFEIDSDFSPQHRAIMPGIVAGKITVLTIRISYIPILCQFPQMRVIVTTHNMKMAHIMSAAVIIPVTWITLSILMNGHRTGIVTGKCNVCKICGEIDIILNKRTYSPCSGNRIGG